MKCSNCNKELTADHAFCPNCGYDLRHSQNVSADDAPQTLRREKTSIQNKLSNPISSIWISFFIGAIVMEIINSQLTRQNASIASLIGSIAGSGAGFLIVVIVPSLAISLIGYAIKKKFPKDEFAILIYIFTVFASCFFLSTLF